MDQEASDYKSTSDKNNLRDILRFWRELEIFIIPSVPDYRQNNSNTEKYTLFDASQLQEGNLPLPWELGHRKSLRGDGEYCWEHDVYIGVAPKSQNIDDRQPSESSRQLFNYTDLIARNLRASETTEEERSSGREGLGFGDAQHSECRTDTRQASNLCHRQSRRLGAMQRFQSSP